MTKENLIKLLLSPIAWIATIGAALIFMLLILLINKKSKAYLLYYALIFIVAGAGLMGTFIILPTLLATKAAAYASLVIPFVEILLERMIKLGIIFVGIGLVMLIIFIIVKAVTKKEKEA